MESPFAIDYVNDYVNWITRGFPVSMGARKEGSAHRWGGRWVAASNCY